MAFTLTSPAFMQGDGVPKKYTCDGEDISPPLRWRDAPPETRSFVVICGNPDTPGIFYHWVAYDIPGHWSGLDEGHRTETLARGFKQAINSFGAPGYGGPCPPRGHAPHVYHFRVCALSIDRLPAGPAPRCEEIVALARSYELAISELVGVYSR